MLPSSADQPKASTDMDAELVGCDARMQFSDEWATPGLSQTSLATMVAAALSPTRFLRLAAASTSSNKKNMAAHTTVISVAVRAPASTMGMRRRWLMSAGATSTTRLLGEGGADEMSVRIGVTCSSVGAGTFAATVVHPGTPSPAHTWSACGFAGSRRKSSRRTPRAGASASAGSKDIAAGTVCHCCAWRPSRSPPATSPRLDAAAFATRARASAGLLDSYHARGSS
mmetsp:Transcript_13102/g.42944  ORF Transcript_13102/g.42944 Transcript_13102/m.42944 type:complete len:227 (-) Transcript_13102:589-1269(-)|eukprot:scaffold25494_cov146-Isochrysis_galbana.AAC.6